MCFEVLGSLLFGFGAAQALKQVKPPAIKEPQKPPQASKTPDRAGLVTANAASALPGGSFSGNSGTFLTGPSGIDPGMLNLGRNSLLGQ